ncbi:hypothetical protein HDU67_004208, partial [Dinochytrium kinnereticum]
MLSVESLITLAVMAVAAVSPAAAQTQTIGDIVKSLVSNPSNFVYQEYAYTLAEGNKAYESIWDSPGTHVLFIPSDRAYQNEDAPINATRTSFPRVTAPNGILFHENHREIVNPIKTEKEVSHAFFYKDYKNRTAVSSNDFNHGGSMELAQKPGYGCLGTRDARQVRIWTGLEGDSNMRDACCAVDVIEATNGIIFVTECPIMAPPSWTAVLDKNGQSLFKGYIQKSGLDKLLDEQPQGAVGKYTLFAPTDSVLYPLQSQLDGYTDAQLKAFVANHLVEGVYGALGRNDGARPISLLGEAITFSGFDYTTEGGSRASSGYPWDLSASGAHALLITSGTLMPMERNRNGSPALDAVLGGAATTLVTTTTAASTSTSAATTATSASVTTSIPAAPTTTSSR